MTPLATAAAPILQAAQLAAENGPALLAIDGRCGSGKSTLAKFLAGQLGCQVVHTDDFYLPLAARCANWQQQPGAKSGARIPDPTGDIEHQSQRA